MKHHGIDRFACEAIMLLRIGFCIAKVKELWILRETKTKKIYNITTRTGSRRDHQT